MAKVKVVKFKDGGSPPDGVSIGKIYTVSHYYTKNRAYYCSIITNEAGFPPKMDMYEEEVEEVIEKRTGFPKWL